MSGCRECGHPWSEHNQLLKGAGKMLKPEYNPDGVVDLYQCDHYTGMGTWCGCEERSRQPLRKVADVVENQTCGRSLAGQVCVVPRGMVHNVHSNAAETFYWITWKDDEYQVAQVTLPDGTVVRLVDLTEDT